MRRFESETPRELLSGCKTEAEVLQGEGRGDDKENAKTLLSK